MTAIATRRIIAMASRVASVIPASMPPFRADVLFGSRREAIFVSAAGSDIAIWRRWVCRGGKAIRDRCQQSRRLEGLGQAPRRAELGRHGEKIRLRIRIRYRRPAGNGDDRDRRLEFANQLHGLQSIHGRHENIETHQVKMSSLECREALQPSSATSATIGLPRLSRNQYQRQAIELVTNSSAAARASGRRHPPLPSKRMGWRVSIYTTKGRQIRSPCLTTASSGRMTPSLLLSF